MLDEGVSAVVSSDSGRSYELIDELGRGGFGSVFKARLVGGAGFAKLVAIKMLHDQGSARPEYANRLRDEARLLARLRHRAIVAVEDLVCLDGRWAVVMEYVEGADLLALIRQGPVPPRAATELALEIASALQVIHGATDAATGRPLGIVHRDLKPSNIRVTPHGEVKLLDFGIARAAFPGREAVTGSVRFESAGYVSPERIFGLDTAAGDVFSLGVVLYESLAGQRLGMLSERQVIFEMERTRALAGLAERLQDPQPLVSLLERMLAFEDRDRPSAAQVADALREVVQVAPGPWLARWAPEALRRATEAPVSAVDEVSSAESLERERAVDEPPYTVGLSLPVAPRLGTGRSGATVEAPAAPENPSIAEAPVEAQPPTAATLAEAAPPTAPAPAEPPPAEPAPQSLAAAPAARRPGAQAPPRGLASVLPPVANRFIAVGGGLMFFGAIAISLLIWASGPTKPPPEAPPEPPSPEAPTAEAPPVSEAPPVFEAPVQASAEPAAPPPQPTPSPQAPAAEPTAERPGPAPAPRGSEAAARVAKRPIQPAESPVTSPPAPATTGQVVIQGRYAKAELVSAEGARRPVGEVPAGRYLLRVLFDPGLQWVETGIALDVPAGGTITVPCSFEREACRAP